MISFYLYGIQFNRHGFSGSRGDGLHPGGDGVIRDIEFRIPVQVSILSERRVYHPYGMDGGEPAKCGLNLWVRQVKDETGEYKERIINLGGKNTAAMKPGERIIICTPGGGGYGEPDDDDANGHHFLNHEDPTLKWRAMGSLSTRAFTQETN